ncbi:MAG TPA: SCO family protein, partial [Polyangiaceae bacterium]
MNRSLVRVVTKSLAVLALGFVSLAFEPSGHVKAALAHDESQAPVPAELQKVDVTEHLDAPIPQDAHFKDQDGKDVTVGDYFGKKPIALILAYHRCPVLCGLIQHAAATTFKDLANEGGWVVGKQYDVVVLSIDPTDTPEMAKQKRDEIVAAYGIPESVSGFHYIVGDKGQIDRVANATGFGYQYDARQNQYAHPAVLMLVKPDGEMARYLYGLAFEANDLKFGL